MNRAAGALSAKILQAGRAAAVSKVTAPTIRFPAGRVK